jgi:hypothetical protein
MEVRGKANNEQLHDLQSSIFIIIVIVIFSRIRPLGLFRFRIYFSEAYESIGQLVGLLGRGISPTQGLYLHRTT